MGARRVISATGCARNFSFNTQRESHDGQNTAQTVTIIGAGIGGLYLVAELDIAGFKLRLHDIDDSRLSEIRARDGVDVEGERGGFVTVDRVTTDLPSAVNAAGVIIVVTGGNARRRWRDHLRLWSGTVR